MKQYEAKRIKNIAILGHSGCGKTSVAESMVYLSGASERLGKVSDGSTLFDFDPEEIKRKVSVSSAVAPVEWKGYKINLIDTPGLFDFEGGVREGIRAADTAMIVISGKDSVDVGTDKAVKMAENAGMSKVFFVNGLCDESARFYRVFETLKAHYGPSVCPVVVPFIENGQADCYVNILEYKAYKYTNGKIVQTAMPNMGDRLEGLRTAVYEAVAETSEEMFEKYFSGEEFTPEEVIVGVSKGVKNGTITPVFCGDAQNTYGIEQLLNGIIWLVPSADEKSEIAVDVDGEPIELSVNSNGAASAIVFKTVADPFVGKLSYFKVISGKVSADIPLINMRTGENERITKVFVPKGKKQEEVPFVGAGDIGAVAKLSGTATGDTLCSPTRKVILEGIEYPVANYKKSISPKNKGDEDKVAQALIKLMEEDLTSKFETNKETKEMILSGLGEQHIDVIVSKLKNKFNIDVVLGDPKIAYRETIRSNVKVQGRHKKQSGGHGQFGDVWIEFEPADNDGLEFAERVVGGSVPKGFFPAVEKGLAESIKKGPLAGYPMVGLKATLYDGSYHPVDSSEMSFKMAASAAYKAGMPKANPILLEPVMSLSIVVSDSNMGDIMGEINKRRGRVLGMDPGVDNMQTINAEAPVAEMSNFAVYLRQVTQGRGSYTSKFARYEAVPENIAEKIIESRKSE